MTVGLPISNVVAVSINLSAIAATYRNFGALCIAGPTDVISASELIRAYSNNEDVGADFGTTAPEYLASTDFFSQSPEPSILYIARWLQTASRARLTAGYISQASQPSFLTSIALVTNGSFSVNVNAALVQIAGMNFSTATTMNQVAAIINTAFAAYGTCVWDANNNQFILRTTTTGINAAIGYLGAGATGTSIAATINGTQANGAILSQGAAAQTPLACAQNLMLQSNDWYGLMFAPTNTGDISTSDHLAVGGAIEAANPSRIYGVTTQDPGTLTPPIIGTSTDLAFLLSNSVLERVVCQYSSNDPYAIASLYGRGFTVDFTANNSTITLNGKVEPGVKPETLNLTQSNYLKQRNCNVFIDYSNAAALIQYGTMCNGYYFDEVQGTDWLGNEIQTDLYNKIINAPTKIPQTDAGNTQLKTTATASMEKAVTNGLVAPGYWQGPAVGTINTGDFLPNGYYIYMAPIATQATPDRQARKAVTMQIAACLAGAIHSASVLMNIQR